MTVGTGVGDHPARILVVDDEWNDRQLLGIMLASEGFDIRTAASGKEALAIVAEQPPDLILLDVMMPGMDGFEMTARMKGNVSTRNIPIIMVTALDDRSSRMLGLSAGAEDFLSKPVDHTELCVRVRNLVRLKTYSDYYDRYSQMLEGEVSSRTAELVERTATLERQTTVLAEQAALLDLAQDAIVVRDMKSRIVFWSRGAEVMYGWPSATAVGLTTLDLLNTEFSEPVEHIDAELLRAGHWEGEVIDYTRDHKRLMVASRWALQRDTTGTPVQVLTINNDISARKEADAELLLLTERLSLATAVAGVGVWEWDLASNTLAWDATMFAIYGLPRVVPLAYEQWSAAVHPEDLPTLEAMLQTVIRTRGEGAGEFRIILGNGTVKTLYAVERVVLDKHARVARLIGVSMDVTERKAAEQALEQTRKDRMRFKDEFLSHVSHELRSPLTAIKQFTSILLGGVAGELNGEQRQYQQIVLRNIQQLQSMIDDLLEVTRLETGKLSVEPENVSVADAVSDALDTLQVTATAKGVTLSSDLPEDLPSAYADQTRLRQILIILLDNAIKFTSDGDRVMIQARRLQRDPRFLQVDVSDTGCGISPEMTERMFERLYQISGLAQGSRKGLGLGLYICKELVTRLGGHIWVTSEPQKGSTFSFTLPVFSLSNVIAPLVRNGEWPAESLALVMVEPRMPGIHHSSEDQQRLSREVRALLQHCLLPDLDVLLPKLSSGPEEERRFFVAALTDERGASALANTIREQLERVPHLQRTGLTLQVSYRMLPSSPLDGASVETIVTDMATTLEASIASHISSEEASS